MGPTADADRLSTAAPLLLLPDGRCCQTIVMYIELFCLASGTNSAARIDEIEGTQSSHAMCACKVAEILVLCVLTVHAVGFGIQCGMG